MVPGQGLIGLPRHMAADSSSEPPTRTSHLGNGAFRCVRDRAPPAHRACAGFIRYRQRV